MASVQETLRAVLGADPALTALVEDRIYPGQIPADEAETPWVYYATPESVPFDELGDDTLTIKHSAEFHALADTYALAKRINDAIVGVLNFFSGSNITRAFWTGSSEEVTEYGYHHASRFDIWEARVLRAPVSPPAPASVLFGLGAYGIPFPTSPDAVAFGLGACGIHFPIT